MMVFVYSGANDLKRVAGSSCMTMAEDGVLIVAISGRALSSTGEIMNGIMDESGFTNKG